MEKWRLVSNALRLKGNQKLEIAGKSVLLLDDNLTDGITYLVARKLLLEAGAREVGLVTLTRTIREKIDLEAEQILFS